MLGLFIAFFTSLLTSIVIIATQKLHGRFSLDHDLNGIQKFHQVSVPRIGGISIEIGRAHV